MKLTKPALKKPDIAVPPFLADIYYDLRERRLLPLVALVVVAIFAVPFLLGGDSEEAPPVAEEPIAGSSALEDSDPASLTVVQAKPGLRDYKKRLRGRTPTDPFEQRYTGVPEGAELSVETSTTSTSTTTSGSGESGAESDTTSGSTGSAPGSGPPSSGSGDGSGGSDGPAGGNDDGSPLDGKRLFGFRPDVRFGVAGSENLRLREELPLGSFLPRGNPIVVFIGVTQNGKRALFDVAREIASVEGSGDCVGGKQSCRILSLQAGQAVTLQTGVPGRAFRLSVVDIDFVEVDIPKKASSSTETEPRAAGLSQSFSN